MGNISKNYDNSNTVNYDNDTLTSELDRLLQEIIIRMSKLNKRCRYTTSHTQTRRELISLRQIDEIVITIRTPGSCTFMETLKARKCGECT